MLLLKPTIGFGVRVIERGRTNLGSMLSNKNLWSGKLCGRGQYRPCAQDEEKKEPCTDKNIVYESGKCNPLWSRKEADREGLREKRDIANLYVGESATSRRAVEGCRNW